MQPGARAQGFPAPRALPRRLAATSGIGLLRIVGSPRRLPWLLVPTLAVAVAGSAFAPVAVSSRPWHARLPGVRRLAVRLAAGGVSLSGSPLLRLPLDRSATMGKVPFSAAPPRRTPALADPPGSSAGIPLVAIAAYEHAQAVLALRDPGCHLSWEEVAGIGEVESDNGLTWGSAARVTANGTLVPPIYGIPLNGRDGTPAMPAPHGGWVRAEGPMQFLPATWAEYAQVGHGRGPPNPQNFYDAALTTAVFLCTNGGNLESPPNLKAAIFAYNHSTAYVSLVEAWIAYYGRAGVRALTSAGDGLLPLAPAGQGHSATGGGPSPPGPAGLVAAASVSSEETGSYTFSLRVVAGASQLASGAGAVAVPARSARLELDLPGQGVLQMRVVSGKSYLSLPPALAGAAGAQGTWIVMTPTVLSRLPAAIASGLLLASDDVVWLVGQLVGATDMRVMGYGRIDGAAATGFAGLADLAVAVGHLPEASVDLRRVAGVLRSPLFGFQAWVSQSRVRSAELSFSAMAGVGPISVDVAFSGYGNPVEVAAPQVDPTSTTTTTTTTTSTTTTTLPPGTSTAG